jgi:hypothetical protein
MTSPDVDEAAAAAAAQHIRNADQLARYTPVAPTGLGGQITGAQLAELGAILGAAGAEKGATTALLHAWQQMAIKFAVEGFPAVMAQMDELIRARVMRAIQEIKALPVVPYTVPTSMGDRWKGIVPPTYNYVNQEQVLRVLFAVMGQAPLP